MYNFSPATLCSMAFLIGAAAAGNKNLSILGVVLVIISLLIVELKGENK